MILSNVNIGTGPSAGDGDPLRSAFGIINNNFQIVTNNVNALTNSVTSVAGRTGNVILTTQDIVGLNATYATQANTLAANVGMRGYVDYTISANISALVNAAPSTLDTIRELADAIGDDPNFAVNIALSVSSANTKMRSYVDGQITAANAGVTSANLGLKGYVDQANTIQSAQVGAANLAITAANVGMKGYVDNAVATSGYSNVQVATYLPTYTGNILAGNVKSLYGYGFTSGVAKISNNPSSIVLTPDTGADALAGVAIGGNGYLLGPNSARNIILNYNGVGGAVGLQGNVTVGAAGSGNLWVYGNVLAVTVSAGNVSTTGTIKTGVFTASTLPTASSVGAGTRSFITDANTITFGSAVTTGGANAVPVYSDGTSWRVG